MANGCAALATMPPAGEPIGVALGDIVHRLTTPANDYDMASPQHWKPTPSRPRMLGNGAQSPP